MKLQAKWPSFAQTAPILKSPPPSPPKKQSCRMTEMRHILSASLVKTLQLIICKIHVLLCLYLFQRGPGPQPPAPPVH